MYIRAILDNYISVDSGTRWIADIARSLGESDLETQLLGIAEAFGRCVDVQALEFGRGESEARFTAVRRRADGWVITRGRRETDAVTREAMRLGQPRIERRRRDGPRPRLIVPIDRGAHSYLALWSADGRLPEVLRDSELLGVVAQLLAQRLGESSARHPKVRGPETFAGGSRRIIEDALQSCDGKIYGEGGAAERLDLHPGTLQSKMRKLGIDRKQFVPTPDPPR